MEDNWLKSPLGADLLQTERTLVGSVAEGVFGEIGLQVGQWGPSATFADVFRTQRSGLVSAAGNEGVALVSAPHQLGIESDSVDVMLLPHTLDVCEHPHAALREAARVLRSDGQLIILAFKTGGAWGLRRLLPGAVYPPVANRLLAERQLTDWLELLDIRIMARERYFFRLPWQPRKVSANATYQQWGARFWPEFAACYLLRAQKRLRTLTPVTPAWRRPKKVVASLVKPSTRVARLRIDSMGKKGRDNSQ